MSEKALSTSKFVFLTAIALGIVAGLDRGVAFVFGEQTLAPLASLLFLAAFSFFLSPTQIALTIPFFAVESFVLIREASPYPYVRTASVVLGGMMAWAIRVERLKISTQLSEVDTLLAQLPAPWLMVDSSGNILQASKMAIATLGMSLNELQASSFSFLFSPAERKGDFIQTFLRVVDHHQGVAGLELFSRRSDRVFLASFAPLTSSRGTSVLVVLNAKNG